MKIPANIFIDQWGGIRITKGSTRTKPTELAVQLVIDVPDVFFNRPMPRVNIAIPQEYLINPDTHIVAKWVAQDVAEAIKVDVKTVEDGLFTMMAARLQDTVKEDV